MADVTYRIVIEGAGGEGPGGKSTATTSKGDETNLPKNPRHNGTKTALKVMAGVGYAMKAAQAVGSYYISTISLRTGQTTLQQRIDFAHSRIWGYASSAVNGFVGGLAMSGGNLFGAAVGAAIGFTASVFGNVIEEVKNADRIRLLRQEEDISIRFANVRAGSMGGRDGRSEY